MQKRVYLYLAALAYGAIAITTVISNLTQLAVKNAQQDDGERHVEDDEKSPESFQVDEETIDWLHTQVDDEDGNFFAFAEMNALDIKGATNATQLLQELGVHSLSSDVAYLDHCDLSLLNVSTFQRFRSLIMDEFNVHDWAQKNGVPISDVEDDATLQTLEFFSRGVGICDYALYRPTVNATEQQRLRFQQTVNTLPLAPPGEVRIVYLISIFNDLPHLQQLIEAIHLPQHLIVLHLERRASPDFVNEVQDLASHYDNVMAVQYGSITWPSESVTQVFLRLMRFITEDVTLSYDYLFTMGASSYPLWEAHELAQHLYRAERRVHIGRLHYARRVQGLCHRDASGFGLLLSRGMGAKEHLTRSGYVNRLPQEIKDEITPKTFNHLPQGMGQCNKKTNSGNTAAYDRAAVEAILHSPTALDFFARYKQAGSCCSEELSWGSAVSAIGRSDDIDKPAMMWQAWGKRGMHNVQLKYDNSSTWFAPMFVHELAAGDGRGPKPILDYKGLEDEFRAAKARGTLFARKFHSSDQYWVKWIQSNLHRPPR